jgi:hypothetical protein
MTKLKQPILDYQAMQVESLKDLEYAVLSLETTLELADEDGCTDGLSYAISDLIAALGAEKTRELLEPIDVGRPEHKEQMMGYLLLLA